MSSDPLPETSRKHAKKLFEACLGPVSEIGSKRRIIIVPDGSLNSVGFDSLIDQSDHYLIRSRVVSYVPSATLLHMLRGLSENTNAPYSLLAFGAPEAPKSMASVLPTKVSVNRALLDATGGNIPQLQSASGEVRTIAFELGGPSKLFIGSDATEQRFKLQPLDKFQVVHFATHAFADVTHPERSAIVLATDRKNSEDGLLQIREIRKLSLKADLVTLSACDAGAGRLAGMQGLESLLSAFQFAGARSVLASRWLVDDTFTASLMTDTYRELGRGASVVEALRKAQLSALERFGNSARPVLWSAFFVSGEPGTTVHVSPRKPQ